MERLNQKQSHNGKGKMAKHLHTMWLYISQLCSSVDMWPCKWSYCGQCCFHTARLWNISGRSLPVYTICIHSTITPKAPSHLTCCLFELMVVRAWFWKAGSWQTACMSSLGCGFTHHFFQDACEWGTVWVLSFPAHCKWGYGRVKWEKVENLFN